ncbi:hypothetical protein BABINDRAFT_163014 [Babjeviella inositovora NRRL Y-12698]|uniref:DNA recombination and repair protein Rad51-like C-terminal domain-containing protein n=1 Tax=Babjeviella inositovora NRRL Y-12698 TaxID=984486 RepID=A0A1E3QJV3_9ASCO|nr:uncharacterized protein BABINDRAFT_163014 [Babjeviella inositovora NRRL Y-12698]ODQ77963.1 hypothetical protein BABINDRAFT_163014 [Babjeviella inositovora NRRL Y-12698]
MDTLQQIPRKRLSSIVAPSPRLNRYLTDLLHADVHFAHLIFSSPRRQVEVLKTIVSQASDAVLVFDCGYSWQSPSETVVFRGTETLGQLVEALSIESVCATLAHVSHHSLETIVVDNLSVFKFQEHGERLYPALVDALQVLHGYFGCTIICTSWDASFDEGYKMIPTRAFKYTERVEKKREVHIWQKFSQLPASVLCRFDAILAFHGTECEGLLCKAPRPEWKML